VADTAVDVDVDAATRTGTRAVCRAKRRGEGKGGEQQAQRSSSANTQMKQGQSTPHKCDDGKNTEADGDVCLCVRSVCVDASASECWGR